MVPTNALAPLASCNIAAPIALVRSDACIGGVESEERCIGISKRKMKAKVSRRRQSAFKGKLCKYFFARKGCKKGDDCEFAHGEEDLVDKTGLCDFPMGRQSSMESCSSITSCDSTACSERLAAPSDRLSDFGLSEDAEGLEQGDVRWPELGTPLARGDTGEVRSHCHYELNFGGIVAKLRTRNTFVEFDEEEEEEEKPLAMGRVRRVARAASAPPSFRGSPHPNTGASA